MSAPVELLRHVPLFTGLSEKELKTLAENFTQRTFREGTELTAEGQGGVGFFVIESGQALVTVDGHERATLGPGDYFGEMALLSDQPRNATVRSLTPCVCLSLARDLFDRLLTREPELRQYFRNVAVLRDGNTAQK